MAYNKDYNQEEELQSKLNAAGLINSTLEKLWSESYIAMAEGNYIKWNTKLDAIWCILGGDATENGEEEKRINDFDVKIHKLGSLKSKSGVGFDTKANPNNAMQYQWLKRKSIYLRRLQNKQGKGTAYASEDDDDI